MDGWWLGVIAVVVGLGFVVNALNSIERAVLKLGALIDDRLRSPDE